MISIDWVVVAAEDLLPQSKVIEIVAPSEFPDWRGGSAEIGSLGQIGVGANSQTKWPRCSRLAANQKPMPSCTSTFMRLARRLEKR